LDRLVEPDADRKDGAVQGVRIVEFRLAPLAAARMLGNQGQHGIAAAQVVNNNGKKLLTR